MLKPLAGGQPSRVECPQSRTVPLPASRSAASRTERRRRLQVCVARAGTAERDVGRQPAPGQVGRQTAQEKAAGPTSRLTLEQAPPSAGYDRDFSDTYELGQPLGAGSFKTVFVGRHRRTGDRVAVQVIAKDREGTTAADNVARIQKEVTITQLLQVTPETIRLHGVYEDGRNIYMITEMCDGGTLEQYIRNNGKMPETDVAMVVTDVLNVLAECNRQKVCYADIKPANLLLKYRYPDVDPARGGCCDAPPSIRVIDFGCSQMVQEGNKLAKRTGTPLFLPPEMFMRHWGPEADLWSLGMVTYLLLSGEMPFWGGAIGGVPPFMVMQEILGGDIKFDGTAWEGMSGDAIDFVDRLLDRDFNNRMTAEQALQHPWIVAAGSGTDLEECSLSWEDEAEPDYNIMSGNKAQEARRVNHRLVQNGQSVQHGQSVVCSIEDAPAMDPSPEARSLDTKH